MSSVAFLPVSHAPSSTNYYYYSSLSIPKYPKIKTAPAAITTKKVSLELGQQIIIAPNALRRKLDPKWSGGGFSIGVDLGMSRTGLALSKGFSIRPLSVVELRGERLELRLLQLAEQQEADEFIIGLPLSSDGKETQQSNKVRSVCGRLAVRAAKRGWRVYLQDEHGTTTDAMCHMINNGVGKSERHGRIDSYSAVMVLERYFAQCGEGVELVLPKQLDLQEKLRIGPPADIDYL